MTPDSASLLVFTGADLDDGNAAGDDSLVLTLGVATGTLSATTGGGVTVGGTASGSFADKSAGSAKAVTVSGNTITGSQRTSAVRPVEPNALPSSTRVRLTTRWKAVSPSFATGRTSSGKTTFLTKFGFEAISDGAQAMVSENTW